MKPALILLSLCAKQAFSSSSSSWDYEHMSSWSDSYPMCSVSDQPPIDIPLSAVIDPNVCGATLDWNLDFTHSTFQIHNNGHSLSLKPMKEINSTQYMSLSLNENTIGTFPNYFAETDEPKMYCLDSLHFHWGTTDETGSEHLVGGYQCPLQLHFVHYSCDHTSLGSTLAEFTEANVGKLAVENDIDTHQLGVIGIFFDVVDDRMNPAFDIIFTNETLYEKDLSQLIPDHIKSEGYYPDHIKRYIHKSQMEKFRLLFSAESEVQTHNNYTVEVDSVTETTHPANGAMSGIIAILVLAAVIGIVSCAKWKSVPRTQFLTQNAFTNNIINCEQSNGTELSDRFVHVNIDCTDEAQVKEAVNIATKRAFQSRLAAPIDGITKGKVFGEMTMLLPSGLTSKLQFNGECAYHASAEFTPSDISQETFKSDMYYNETSFNPLYKSDKNETSFVENDTNISCTIQANDSYNALSKETAIKLQKQHLSKMKESNKVQKVYQSDTLPTSEIFKISTTAPKESCRAYFTGLIVGGTFVSNNVSVAYKIDNCSEYVGQGEYPQNKKAFPKAVASTFDGIAIDRNTRVVIYEKENFEGNILLDAKGPKIINNGKWKNDARYGHCGTDIFPDSELQNNFPIEVRMWTESDMHQWSYGSVKILSNSF